ncbi:hypothetical protein ACFQPA_13770 [Halomarina halobia]|uniref:Twin-arginine translocation signal domain-containing protein n=1 Tax=Halomarina halobia TaxID=3033386 RepID=A0ABD6A8C8_9EURY|nr:hypothetical protein [Halomarina sp. PSR21]
MGDRARRPGESTRLPRRTFLRAVGLLAELEAVGVGASGEVIDSDASTQDDGLRRGPDGTRRERRIRLRAIEASIEPDRGPRHDGDERGRRCGRERLTLTLPDGGAGP